MQHVPGLYVGNSEISGRGVFSAQSLTKGTVIEVCPVIVFPSTQRVYLDQTKIFEYYFSWPDGKQSLCLALGYGSIYNHADEPNAMVIMNIEAKEIVVEAVKPIPANYEILINYSDGPASHDKLWFRVIKSIH